MKTTLFYVYFMPILMLSHQFFSYFILANLYFIPSLPDEENRASILCVMQWQNSVTHVYVALGLPCLCPSKGHRHGISIQSSINLGNTQVSANKV